MFDVIRPRPAAAPAPGRQPVLACAWVQATVGNEQAGALDVELDRQQAEIREALALLEAERMAADVEAFITALELDLVDADDFAR